MEGGERARVRACEGAARRAQVGATSPRHRYIFYESKDKPYQFWHDPGPSFPCALRVHPNTLTASPLCTMQGEKEETERLEQEEKREKVTAPALRLVQQARLGTLPSDAAWPVRSYRYGARPER